MKTLKILAVAAIFATAFVSVGHAHAERQWYSDEEKVRIDARMDDLQAQVNQLRAAQQPAGISGGSGSDARISALEARVSALEGAVRQLQTAVMQALGQVLGLLQKIALAR